MRAALLLKCPDRPGIVASVGAFVADAGGNIVEADQHSDPEAGLFLQRIEFDLEASRADLADAFAPIARALPDGLAGARPRRPPPRRSPRVAPGPLPRRSPRSVRPRGAPGHGRIGRVEPRRARAAGVAVRPAVPRAPGRRRRPRRAGTCTRRAARSARPRPDRARPVHAHPAAVARRALGRAHDQHPSLVPARRSRARVRTRRRTSGASR